MPRPTAFDRIKFPDPAEEVPDRFEVAEIPLGLLEQLAPAELCRLIEASRHPWRPELQDLRFADPAVIKRLAYLARFCCRNQQAAAMPAEEEPSGTP